MGGREAGCGLLGKHQTHNFQTLSGPENALKSPSQVRAEGYFKGKKKKEKENTNFQISAAPGAISETASSISAPRTAGTWAALEEVSGVGGNNPSTPAPRGAGLQRLSSDTHKDLRLSRKRRGRGPGPGLLARQPRPTSSPARGRTEARLGRGAPAGCALAGPLGPGPGNAGPRLRNGPSWLSLEFQRWRVEG